MTALATGFAAALMLGLVCGLLGTFVVVRRMALTGDMLSHAVLPGVVAGLAWSPDRHPLIVLACAVAAGAAGSFAMKLLLAKTHLKADAALALVLSVFFALGIAMASKLQPAGVQAFLFGQVAAIDARDMKLLAIVCACTLLVVPLTFRTLRLVSFDPSFARLIGLPVRISEALFFFMLSVVIVIAMQSVGVVLVTAMLVTPAAAARFYSRTLGRTAIIACTIGALGGMAGVWISSLRGGLPTGPLMALSVTALFFASAVCGPRSGWLAGFFRRRRGRIRILGEDILKNFWYGEEAHGKGRLIESHELPLDKPVNPALRKLLKSGMIRTQGSAYLLTDAGRESAAQLVRVHRLWERYLTDFAAYPSDHVHDEAERAEHWINASHSREISEKLGEPVEDPHGKPIPPATTTEVRS